MNLSNVIFTLRTEAKLTEERFAALFGVDGQTVARWESGEERPQSEILDRIADHFRMSAEGLENGELRSVAAAKSKRILPQYARMSIWDSYSSELLQEYRQCWEEGLDVGEYRDLFEAAAHMQPGEAKEKIADVLFELVLNADVRVGYPYEEPSDYAGICAHSDVSMWKGGEICRDELEDKIYGAWLGRVCGCLLGKPVEGVHSEELTEVLKASGNYPMRRYIRSTDITDDMVKKYQFPFAGRCYADTVSAMPADDDTNYTVLAQLIVEQYGRNFTAYDVSRAWLSYQPKTAYCTAETVAFRNFVNGYLPPDSGMYKNVYREWIGAQIRGDYFGYINPGDPKAAAEMAYRDASISHVKNGIYGEMFAAAMIACAAATDNIRDIVRGGLSQVPTTSRLFEAVSDVMADYDNGVSQQECFAKIHARYDEHTSHGWCHTISNAMIVTAALLYGEGDYGRSICMAVETAFDTDCNGATVGSILGMRGGKAAIGEEWSRPVGDTVETAIIGLSKVRVSDCVKKAMTHLE